MVSQGERLVQPDLAILLVGVSRAVADALEEAMAAARVSAMRPQFGFVLRALGEHGATLTDLAGRLEVTKQAAIKVVDEMERAGFLERVAHPTDRRAKLLVASERGREVRRVALAASRRMEQRLRRAAGDDDVDALRRALGVFLEQHGGFEQAMAGRARPVW